MTWSVRWHHEAWLNLVKIIAEDVDPPRVEKASDWIDYTLRRIPFDVGESRDANARVWYGDVLGVYYLIDEQARTITISAVGPARR